MFGALLKIAASTTFVKGRYGKTTLLLAGFSGFTTTGLGIALAFFPAQQIKSLRSYEIWMFGGTLFFVGLAAFFFFVYGRRKVPRGNWPRQRRPHQYCELNLGGGYVQQCKDDRSSLSKLHQWPVGQEFFWRNVPCL